MYSGSLKTFIDGMDIKYLSAMDALNAIKVEFPTYNYEVPSGTFSWSNNPAELPSILDAKIG